MFGLYSPIEHESNFLSLLFTIEQAKLRIILKNTKKQANNRSILKNCIGLEMLT